MKTQEQPAAKMDTVEAVRLANNVVSQWREALRAGVDLNAFRGVLEMDMQHLSEALGVLTDWLS